LLDLYKKHFPNYVPKKANVTSSENPTAVAKLNETKNNVNNNNQAHVDGLTILLQANDKEYTTRVNSIPTTLNASQTTLKNKAQTAFNKKNQTVH
jgi:hypothetical protein